MSGHRTAHDLHKAATVRANQIEDPGDAGTINVERNPCYLELISAAAETRTLADPVAGGEIIIITLKTDGGDVTVTADSAVDQAGNTVLTFDDVNDSIALYSIEDGSGTFAWRVLAVDGVGGVLAEGGGFDLNGSADAGILDADGDTTISAPTDDQVDFEVGGSDVLTLTATGLTAAAALGFKGQGSTFAPVIPLAAEQTLAAGGGAVTVTEFYTAGATDVGGDAWTLADGVQVGQLKKIQLVTDGGGDATLTPTNLSGGTTITFADVGDFALLGWDGNNWVALELGNAADGSTAPVLA